MPVKKTWNYIWSVQDASVLAGSYKTFTDAGMLRRVVTRIWNKKHAFRVGIVFEYRDQAAFEACKPLLEKHYLSAVEGLATQVFGSRGVVVHEFVSDEFQG